jgi:hypothetical protein
MPSDRRKAQRRRLRADDDSSSQTTWKRSELGPADTSDFVSILGLFHAYARSRDRTGKQSEYAYARDRRGYPRNSRKFPRRNAASSSPTRTVASAGNTPSRESQARRTSRAHAERS